VVAGYVRGLVLALVAHGDVYGGGSRRGGRSNGALVGRGLDLPKG
jgi:hypothetical protein